jgi:putative Mn2+ efflux pump MntP
MASALLTTVLLGVALEVGAVYYGYRVPRPGAFARHFNCALASTFLLALGHSMTMFFFIGTGKQIKDMVREHDLDRTIVRETIVYKNKLFPTLMLAVGVTMAQFILGGAVHTRVIPVWVHNLLGWAALVSNAYCLALEARYLVENSKLMHSVYREVDR